MYKNLKWYCVFNEEKIVRIVCTIPGKILLWHILLSVRYMRHLHYFLGNFDDR
jgi:hypothetical protein